MVHPAHRAFNNRALLARSSIAGCYSCLATFAPDQVSAWTHEGSTALCPVCSAATVLPGISELAALRAAHAGQADHAETVPAFLSLTPERD